MHAKINRQSEKFLREILKKNSRYRSIDEIVKAAVDSFYALEKKQRFV